MEKNNTAKYFKYAIGEIILVVIGILIALSINNWNESRKVENKKQELILNLISDFEENIEILKSAISRSDSLNYKMNTFFDNAYLSNPKISVDSLRLLSDGFFRPVSFFPIMVSYEEAMANGNLTILKDKELSKDFIKFQERYKFFGNIQDQLRDSYFKGPIWELNKTIGSISLLTGKNSRKDIQQDYDSYLKLINTPLATATLENSLTINRNTNFTLKRLDFISKKIVATLKELKK